MVSVIIDGFHSEVVDISLLLVQREVIFFGEKGFDILVIARNKRESCTEK
jgi:hypothetical protein